LFKVGKGMHVNFFGQLARNGLGNVFIVA